MGQEMAFDSEHSRSGRASNFDDLMTVCVSFRELVQGLHTKHCHWLSVAPHNNLVGRVFLEIAHQSWIPGWRGKRTKRPGIMM